MCGIVGILGGTKSSSINTMLAQIPHRGPDDSGTFIDSHVQLGFRRLSIIDLSPLGHQPMSNQTKTVWIVFNGEIYNYQELRDRLKDKYRFKSKSDTEVLIHGYEEWGIDGLLERVNGMFGLCLYDKKTKQTYLVRDRIGKKPLYYTKTKDFIAFASETKAFFKLPGFSFNLNQEMFELFMGFPYLPNNSKTVIKNVEKIPPGHYARIDTNLNIKLVSYWHIPPAKQSGSFDDDALKLEETLLDSVSKRLVADVPVGILLSGGLDSSLITALAAKNNQNINTITIAFPKSGIDERSYASKVAKHCKTNHHSLSLNTEHVYEDFKKNIAMYDDLSTTDSGLYSTYRLSKEIRKMGVRVVLVGEGADELFGGYSWFNFSQFPFSVMPKKIQAYLYYYAIMRQLPSLKTNRSVSFLQNKLQETNGSFFKQIQAYEANYSLPNHYCMKVDKGTMYGSIEARAPFMDYRVVEQARQINDRYMLRNSYYNPLKVQEKYILREIAKKYLPASIVSRKKRGGMLSVNHLLQEGLKKDKHLILSNPALQEYYGNTYLKNLIESNPSHKILLWQREWILWKSLVFSLWYNHYSHESST